MKRVVQCIEMLNVFSIKIRIFKDYFFIPVFSGHIFKFIHALLFKFDGCVHLWGGGAFPLFIV